jgi:activator of 2-hydroxyglutaryl-CoA dehydratase
MVRAHSDVIALGGGLAQAEEIFQGLQQAVDAKTLPASRGHAVIVPSKLSVEAGAVGAALLGMLYAAKEDPGTDGT